MSVWFAIPSARPIAEAEPILALWCGRGYRIALWRDDDSEPPSADFILSSLHYPGYSAAVNALCREIIAKDPSARWIVTGGDDTEPDPNHAPEEIAEECEEHFATLTLRSGHYDQDATFGVMQPTGDRWACGSIDRIAGSPWMGREFCRRMYGGQGPLFEGYRHMFEDEELQCVAEMLGVFWQRRDITHLHRHFMRRGDSLDAVATPPPPHLVKWNTAEHWNESQALFRQRKACRFPGHQPLPLEVAA